MSKSNNSTGGGIGFLGLLTIVFIVLKLTNYIDWSWWWVLSPVWVPIILVVLILLIVYLTGFLLSKTDKHKSHGQHVQQKTGFAARLESMQKQQKELLQRNEEVSQ